MLEKLVLSRKQKKNSVKNMMKTQTKINLNPSNKIKSFTGSTITPAREILAPKNVSVSSVKFDPKGLSSSKEAFVKNKIEKDRSISREPKSILKNNQ